MTAPETADHREAAASATSTAMDSTQSPIPRRLPALPRSLIAVSFALLAVGCDKAGAIKLGDKGDGSEASKAATRERHAYLNAGHVPDIYRLGQPHNLWELKCYSPFTTSRALGLGSPNHGGTASTAAASRAS